MSAQYTPEDISEATRRLDIAMARLTGAFARDVGVSVPELLALEHLAGGQGLGPSDLGKRLQLTSGAVTSLVDRLAAGGHAVRAPHPSDRRRVVVRRTAKADEELGREAASLVGDIVDLAGRLSEDERRVVGRFLDGLTDIIERTADRACAA